MISEVVRFDQIIVITINIHSDSWMHIRLSHRGPAGLDGSVVCPTGDQMVLGLIPTGSRNILPWRLIMKYFLWLFSPFH